MKNKQIIFLLILIFLIFPIRIFAETFDDRCVYEYEDYKNYGWLAEKTATKSSGRDGGALGEIVYGIDDRETAPSFMSSPIITFQSGTFRKYEASGVNDLSVGNVNTLTINQLDSTFTNIMSNLSYRCPEVMYFCDSVDRYGKLIRHTFGIYTNDISAGKGEDVLPYAICSEYKLKEKRTHDLSGDITKPIENDCQGVIGDALLKKLTLYFNILKIVVPILVIVLSFLDFAKSILSSDNDALKKSQITFSKRLLLAVVFFLLPILVNFLLKLINNSITTCGIG